MMPVRLSLCAAALTLASAVSAAAAPAYVPSAVNLRQGSGTGSEIVAKIPAGSLVDVGTCTEGWCEVEWQGKKGFAIETAIDRSGRVRSSRAPTVTGSVRAPARPAAGGRYVDVDPAPPGVVYEDAPVIYGPGPYVAPYYFGYRPYYGYRRWRYW
jgi:uncharacterized protein YraI